MSDLSEYYARRFKVKKPKKEPKLHYVRWWEISKSICGKDIEGLRTTSDPYKITCIACKCSRYMDGMLSNMVNPGY